MSRLASGIVGEWLLRLDVAPRLASTPAGRGRTLAGAGSKSKHSPAPPKLIWEEGRSRSDDCDRCAKPAAGRASAAAPRRAAGREPARLRHHRHGRRAPRSTSRRHPGPPPRRRRRVDGRADTERLRPAARRHRRAPRRRSRCVRVTRRLRAVRPGHRSGHHRRREPLLRRLVPGCQRRARGPHRLLREGRARSRRHHRPDHRAGRGEGAR